MECVDPVGASPVACAALLLSSTAGRGSGAAVVIEVRVPGGASVKGRVKLGAPDVACSVDRGDSDEGGTGAIETVGCVTSLKEA